MFRIVAHSFSQRLSTIAPSATLAMAAEAQKLSAQGVKVYPFSVGEPDFPTPQHICAAAKDALDRGATRYTAVPGTLPLREAICASTAACRGYTPTPDRVVVAVGAKHALFNLAMALVDPGDEVIIPAPYWVSYPEQVRLFGGTPILVQTGEATAYRMTPAQLRASVTPKTKALILCTPSNPTGSAYSRAELEGLLEVIREGDYYVIVDEIYADLVYDGFEHVSLGKIAPDLADRLVIVDGVSKTYAMTGFRIGWTISSKRIADALTMLQGQSTTNATAVAQAAAIAALRGPREELETMRATFQARRDMMVAGLNTIPRVKCRTPEGAFYAFADVSALLGLTVGDRTLATDEDIAFWFLRAAHVAGVAGTPFGAPGHMRFSYAASEADITAGVAALRELVTRALEP